VHPKGKMMKKVLADDELILYQPISGDLMHELNREKCLLREGNSKLAGGEDVWNFNAFAPISITSVPIILVLIQLQIKHEKIH